MLTGMMCNQGSFCTCRWVSHEGTNSTYWWKCNESANKVSALLLFLPLQWRHNGRDGVSDHQPHDCLLNRLFRRRSKKTSKLRITGLCAGNSPVTGEFPAQMVSNAENVSIWWCHHAYEAETKWPQFSRRHFQLRYQWIFFPRIQLAILQNWFR